MNNRSKNTSGKVLCRTPNQPDGGKGTHIAAWKFKALESAVRRCLDDAPDRMLGFMALSRGTRAYLNEEQIADMGTLGWYATAVILEMEFRGDLKATKVKGKKILAFT